MNSFSDNLWLIYGLLATQFLQQYVQQFSRSIDRIEVYSITGIVATVCTALFTLLILPRYGVMGYVWSLILANICATAYSFIHSGAYRYISIKGISKSCCIEMLKFSVPLIPNGLMWWLVSTFNRPLMESHLGMHAIGIFAAANKLPGIVTMLFAIFFYSWQISVIEEFGQKNYSFFYNRILKALLFVLCTGSILISVSSKYIIEWMTEGKFHEGWIYVPVLAIAPIFHAISSFVGANFSATKESKYIFYSSAFGAIASILLNIILIPICGIWGAVISIVASHCCMALARIWYSWRYAQISDTFCLALMLVATAISAFAVTEISNPTIKYPLIALMVLFIVLLNKSDIKSIIYAIKGKTKEM